MMHMHHTDWYLLARDGRPPPPWEDCLKETFFLHPGERIRVAGHFADYTGKFVIHCHMLDHEDHGLMAQFEVVGAAAGGAMEAGENGAAELVRRYRAARRDRGARGARGLPRPQARAALRRRGARGGRLGPRRPRGARRRSWPRTSPGRCASASPPVEEELIAAAGPAGAAHRGRRDRRPPGGGPRRRCWPTRGPAPLVLLEDPRTMGNMGACVRVAAAADAAGVLTTGGNDPWHPDALRGAAGLHYALPVAAVEALPEQRPAAGRDRSRRGGAAPGRAAAAGDPRLRHRALRAQPGAARARRRAPRDPDAGGGLEPQPGDLGRRRAFLGEALNLGGGSLRSPGQMGTHTNSTGRRGRLAAAGAILAIAALALFALSRDHASAAGAGDRERLGDGDDRPLQVQPDAAARRQGDDRRLLQHVEGQAHGDPQGQLRHRQDQAGQRGRRCASPRRAPTPTTARSTRKCTARSSSAE